MPTERLDTVNGRLDTLDDLTTHIMLTILDGEQRPTAIATRVGTDRFTVTRRLHHLKDEGLITWEPGKQGTLRPLATIEAVTS